MADDLHPSVQEVIGIRLPRYGETGGEFHMHGGIINVTTKQDSGVTVVGIHNDPVGGVSHTLATCASRDGRVAEVVGAQVLSLVGR